MSSTITRGNREKDGSITIYGSKGAKEFEISAVFIREEAWTSTARVTLNVSADSGEDAMEWIACNASEIENLCCRELDYEQSECGPDDIAFDSVSKLECNGEVVRQNLKVRVEAEAEG